MFCWYDLAFISVVDEPRRSDKAGVPGFEIGNAGIDALGGIAYSKYGEKQSGSGRRVALRKNFRYRPDKHFPR
jgi:hypothetical protein